MEAKISVERASELAAELADLSRQHSESLRAATFLPMTADEGKEYDQRRTRMSQLLEILGRFKASAIETKPESGQQRAAHS